MPNKLRISPVRENQDFIYYRNSANFQRKLSNRVISIFIVLLLSGCVTIYNPATQRQETLLIDTKSEIALGGDIDIQMQRRLKILRASQMQNRLDYIGNKVAGFSDRGDLSYYFRIVDDKELNAFAIPGGFIYVNSGLIQNATDGELAGVLAHEIGHIAARHSVKKLQATLGYQIIMSIVLGISNKQTIGETTDIIFNLVSLGYNRQDEFLADKLAVKYVKRAGFNPYAMLTFFKQLKKEAEKQGPHFNLVFLSSHPPIKERIKNIENEIALNH